MRRWLASVCALTLGTIVGITASGGGTLAAFSDATSNPDNTFAAAADFGGTGVTPIKNIGTVACGASANSLSVPAGGVPVGNTLIARLALRNTINASVNINDNRNNDWTRDADVFEGNVRVVVFSAYITNALAQNDQITVTFPANGSAAGLAVTEYSGIAATNRVDATGTAIGNSTLPSATVTTTNSNDMLYGAVAALNLPTYSEPGGWTTAIDQRINCFRDLTNHGATRQVTSSGTYTYNPTLSSQQRWAAAIVAYRAASGGPACGAPTSVYLTGYEHGPLAAGAIGLQDGYAISGGVPDVESAIKRTGAYSLKVPKTTSGASYAERAFPASRVAAASFALRLESLPSTDVSTLVRVNATGGSELDLEYNSAQNRFELAFGTAPGTPASGTVQAGRWYVFDLKVDYGASPRTAEWRIDGVAQPQHSLAEPAAFATEFRIGSDVGSDAYSANYDDVFVSVTAGDYPLGAGRVLALRPDGEGSSNVRSNFGNETGTLVGTNPHLRLDDDPMNSTADYVWQDTASSTSYLELTFQDITLTCVRGVSGIVAFNSASGTPPNLGKTSFFDGTTERTVFSGDMSGTALRYGQAAIQPAGAYWTQSALNGLEARIGYSNDNVPPPHWHALLLEYGTLP